MGGRGGETTKRRNGSTAQGGGGGGKLHGSLSFPSSHTTLAWRKYFMKKTGRGREGGRGHIFQEALLTSASTTGCERRRRRIFIPFVEIFLSPFLFGGGIRVLPPPPPKP